MRYWKRSNRGTLLWKAKYDRSISIMEDQILERFRIIISLLWGYIAGKMATMKDRLCTGIDKDITAIENSLQNSWTQHMTISNIYLDLSLSSVVTNSLSLPMKRVFVSLDKNCRLLVIDSLPQTAIKYHVISCFSRLDSNTILTLFTFVLSVNYT